VLGRDPESGATILHALALCAGRRPLALAGSVSGQSTGQAEAAAARVMAAARGAGLVGADPASGAGDVDGKRGASDADVSGSANPGTLAFATSFANAPDGLGGSPLYVALMREQWGFAGQLLRSGASLEAALAPGGASPGGAGGVGHQLPPLAAETAERVRQWVAGGMQGELTSG